MADTVGCRFQQMSLVHRNTEKLINLIAARISGNQGDTKTPMSRSAMVRQRPVYAVVPANHITPGIR